MERRDSQRPRPPAPARKAGLALFVFVGRPIASETGRPGSFPPPPPVYCITPPARWGGAGGRRAVTMETACRRHQSVDVAEIAPWRVPGEAGEVLVPAGGGIAGVFPN